MSLMTITPEELNQKIRQGEAVDLVDVRNPFEFRQVHAKSARLVPLDRLDPRAVMQFRGETSNRPLYLICRSGHRSRQAAERFRSAGYSQVVNVEGGTLAWERAGLPVVRGGRMISLERQVRIAAGSLVVLGVSLGVLVHPGFLGLSAFVGAGLMFSGISDTCGMGLVLARMPWNVVAANPDRPLEASSPQPTDH